MSGLRLFEQVGLMLTVRHKVLDAFFVSVLRDLKCSSRGFRS